MPYTKNLTLAATPAKEFTRAANVSLHASDICYEGPMGNLWHGPITVRNSAMRWITYISRKAQERLSCLGFLNDRSRIG